MKALVVLGCAILVINFIGADKDMAPDIWGRRQLRGPFKAGCRCKENACECCAEKMFFAKKSIFDLKGCVDAAYINDEGFVLALKVNDRILYEHTVSLKQGLSVCRGVPRLLGFQANVCMVVYNIDVTKPSFCVKLGGIVDFKIKKFEINIPIACMSLKHQFAENNMTVNTYLISDEDPSLCMHQEHPDMNEGHKELPIADLQTLLEDNSIREYVYDEIRTFQGVSADETPETYVD